jgi:hypothetical protein
MKNLDAIFSTGETINIQQTSYIVSYPHIREYFASRQVIGASELVCGAHMIYGWMPTILTLHVEESGISLSQAALLLEKAKEGKPLSDQNLSSLSAVVNNSLVGTSKLLHFVAPESFAIWDSNIYRFLYRKQPHNYRMQNIQTYRDYVALLCSAKDDPRFSALHSSVTKQLGYEVSPMRSLELSMFLRSTNATNELKGDMDK